MINEAHKEDPFFGSAVSLETEIVDSYMQKNPFPANNQSIMEEGVSRLGYLLKYANENVRKNKEIVISALNDEYNSEILQFVHQSLRSDKSFIMDHVIGKCYYILPHLSDDLKKDKELVLKIIERNGYDLRNASEEWKNDREIIGKACKTNLQFSFENASMEIQQDKEFWKKVISSRECSFLFGIPSPLNDDSELMNTAIEKDPFIVSAKVSNRLKSDREFMFKAAKLDGSSLRSASTELQDDYDIVYAAVKSNGVGLEFASEKLKNNEIIVMEAVKSHPTALYHAQQHFNNNRQIVKTAVKGNGIVLKWATEELQDDIEIVLEAVKSNGQALEFSSPRLRCNKMIVMEAVKQNAFSIRFASEDLQNNEEVLACQKLFN